MIPKNYNDFIQTLKEDAPNSFWPEALKALWYDGKGDWVMAHDIAQDIPTQMGSRIHAYLHRKEGCTWNAGYWYQQAKTSYPSFGLDQEFCELVDEVLKLNTV